MDLELVIAILSTGVVTSLVNHVFNRRKNKIEIADKINQMATRLSVHQDDAIKRLEEDVRRFRQEIEALTEKSRRCQEANNRLKKELDGLNTRVNRRGLG